MLDILRTEIAERHKVEWIDVCRLGMAHCTGCMLCRESGECVLPRDDAHRVGERIARADALIVGTPTWWRNMSSPLKQLFDRNVYQLITDVPKGMPRPRHKGKPAAIVATCTTPWPFNFLLPVSRRSIRSVKYILKTAGYDIAGTFALPGTRSLDETPSAALRRVRELARTIHYKQD